MSSDREKILKHLARVLEPRQRGGAPFLRPSERGPSPAKIHIFVLCVTYQGRNQG